MVHMRRTSRRRPAPGGWLLSPNSLSHLLLQPAWSGLSPLCTRQDCWTELGRDGPGKKRTHRHEMGNGSTGIADLARREEGAVGRIMTPMDIGSYALDPITLHGKGTLEMGSTILRWRESPELWGGPELGLGASW